MSSQPQDYRPIGVAGEPVYLGYRQLEAVIRRRLGEDCANFLARPETGNNGRIDWHAVTDGPVRRWVDLEPAEQAELHAKSMVVVDRISDLLVELQLSDETSAAQRSLSFRLEAIFSAPNVGCLFFVGDQPVQALWGFRDEGEAFDVRNLALPMPQSDSPIDAVLPGVTPVLGHSDQRRRWWWLIPLLLLSLLLLLLLVRGCDKAAVTTAVNSKDEERQLAIEQARADEGVDQGEQRDLGKFRHEGIRSGRGVDPGAPLVNETSPDQQNENSDDDEFSESSEVEKLSPDGEFPEGEVSEHELDKIEDDPNETLLPELDPPAEEMPRNEPPPEDESTSPPEIKGADGKDVATEPPQDSNGPKLQLPEGLGSDSDLSFLEGDWSSDSGVTDRETGRPVEMNYDFDESGEGVVTIQRDDGVACKGAVKARPTESGGLRIEDRGRVQCPDGRSYDPSITDCRPTASGRALCKGKNADGTVYDVEINR